jgi:hypothetical protein
MNVELNTRVALNKYTQAYNPNFHFHYPFVSELQA